MVRCPKCGKINQDSSLFCSQCGATLPQTRIRCPECGTMNPIGNVFCSQCNTRLLSGEMQLPEEPKPAAEEAPAGVKGISLPTLPTAKEGALEPEELPDWLLELTEQSLGKSTETPSAAEPTPSDQFPDWLSSLTGDTADNLTDETSNIFSVDESTPEEESAFSELPDWFSELTGDTSAPGAAEPEETAADATPDWLAGLLEDETAEGEVEATSDLTASSLAASGLEEAAEEEPVLEELPDWLSDLTPEEPATASVEDIFEMAPPSSAWEAVAPAEPAPSSPDFAAEPRAEFPEWLLATAVPTPPGEAPISQPLPEWLSKNAEEFAPTQEAGEPSDAGQFPAWLMKGAEPGTVSAAPRMPASSHPEPVKIQKPAHPAVETVPTPSAVAKPEEAPQASAPESGAPESGTPDWLLGIYEEEIEPQTITPAAEVTSEAEETAGGLPDWLAGIYGEEEGELQVPISTTEPEETGDETGEAANGLPDWLAGIYSEEEEEPLGAVFTAEPEDEEIAPETAVPDWLAGVMAEEPIPEQPQVSTEGEEASPAPGETADNLPDWLAGLVTETPAEEERPTPFATESPIFTEAAPEEPSPATATTPDWLKGVTAVDKELALKQEHPAFVPSEATSGTFEEEYEEPVLEGGEIPDWLKGLKPSAPSSVEEEAAFIERVSEDESLVRAEVPSWLQGLRPPGTGPLPPLPEMMMPGADVPPPEEGGLVRAEIPDWVQQLRPVPSAKGEQRPLELAETEGPLAGLRGVLPSGLAMDMPTDFQPAPPPAIPESIVAQAQLWQKLLEQPRSVQRPVAQHRTRSGKGQLATRLIVAVILLAVTVLGLLWDNNIPLSQAIIQPHIEHLSKAIDALESGDTVIVAMEYGPAEAGEMTTLAEAVMQHLADRNAQMIVVSTLPEGTGLIQGLLEPLDLTNSLPAGQTAYLSGSSNGVAQFLSKPAEAKMIVVLAGRAERLRWWVEQNNATQALPMAMAVNAATAPLAMPYLETSSVVGWMVGLPDVAAYQQFRLLTSSILDSQLNALMLTHWAALALLLFGLFYYLALGKKGAS
ncbi:MAG: zinc-ribbon domain-containing protein [Anaerolineae bacterium]|nr:zinc-ribbon domain-containing protein [Anaerolineae bacterium]